MLETMQIFKFLPAAKKSEYANCKKCGYPSCMAFSLKLSKGQTQVNVCPYAPVELRNSVLQALKIQQKTAVLDGIKIGGENVLFRHQKTFINQTAFFVRLNPNDNSKLQEILNYEIESVGVKFKIDGVILDTKNDDIHKTLKDNGFAVIYDDDIKNLQKIQDDSLKNMLSKINFIRRKAIIERDVNFSEPLCVEITRKTPCEISIFASACICNCVNMLIFNVFDAATLTTLITLRQNIYTDPEKPLQVKSKVYEINNPDENAYVLLTTNFALTYFAVANELSSLKNGSYLIITPSEGMSVLTAWSAQKITSQIAAKVVEASGILNKVKHKNLIIPGLLSDLKDELQERLTDWNIITGPVEAYKLPEFLKKLTL